MPGEPSHETQLGEDHDGSRGFGRGRLKERGCGYAELPIAYNWINASIRNLPERSSAGLFKFAIKRIGDPERDRWPLGLNLLAKAPATS